MGYSGLIYAVIVAAWAAVLVPRWARRNEEVEHARETDAARGVRVLQRRSGPVHAPHRPADAVEDDRTVLHGEPAGLTAGAPEARTDRPPRAVRDPAVALDRSFARAARNRRRVLSVIVLATVIVAVATATGRLPAWALGGSLGLLVTFLFLARRAAVALARRRTTLRRRAARLRATGGRAAASGSVEAPADGKRPLVIDEPEAPAVVDEHAWEPVPVPLPTYMTKPMAPRAARTIDLGQPGSWTSGRLDPAASIELPPRARSVAEQRPVEQPAEADSEELPERRRAVGD